MKMKKIGHDDVILCAYDPRWRSDFDKEKTYLAKLLEDAGLHPQILHVGSTSIDNMPSKPIVDILILLSTEEEVMDGLLELIRVGYSFLGDGGRTGRLFLADDGEPFPHYLHVTTADNQVAKDQMRFKEILLNSHEIMEDYIAVKEQVAALYPENRTNYRKMKGYFIDAVLRAYEAGVSISISVEGKQT